MTQQQNDYQEMLDSYGDRHPSTVNCMKWLIPSDSVRAQKSVATDIAMDCARLSIDIVDAIENDSPELTAGLRKLLEAKDCFVRAALDEKPGFWTDR